MALNAVGLLSPGDMGHVVGKVLIDHGMRVITCLDGRSERTRGLAKAAGIEALPSYDDLVREAGLILSILVPAQAQAAAQATAQALERVGGANLVYVDCNAIAPETAQKVGAIVTAAGARFVDAGIIGGPPRRKGATRFYASGPDTEAFESLRDYGLDVRVIGKEFGQASGLKMTYAALTKGTTALITELLTAAHRMGLYEALMSEFELSQKDRAAAMQGLVSMPTKARRWVGEMEEIAKTFRDLGLTPRIYKGAADMYRLVGETPLADETPETLDKSRTLEQMIQILANQQKKKAED